MHSAGHDDAQTACVHVWALKGVHLVLGGLPQFEDECGRCEAIRFRDRADHRQAEQVR